MTTITLATAIRAAGYEPRRAELLALTALEQQRGGVRALLVEGPAGAGKTALAEAYATATGARLVYALLHSWSDDQELFRGVDVCAAVAGDAARVSQPGVLAVAAEASQAGPVVVCLDEVDKAPERVECLLLDVLQSGRVPVRPGEHVAIDLARTTLILTSNGVRPLGEPLLRRCRRVRMAPLPVDTLDRIAGERSGARRGGGRGSHLVGAGDRRARGRRVASRGVDRRRARAARAVGGAHGDGRRAGAARRRGGALGRGGRGAPDCGDAVSTITLRDLRRTWTRSLVWARPVPDAWAEWAELHRAEIATLLPSELWPSRLPYLGTSESERACARLLDRLIAEHGPRADAEVVFGGAVSEQQPSPRPTGQAGRGDTSCPSTGSTPSRRHEIEAQSQAQSGDSRSKRASSRSTNSPHSPTPAGSAAEDGDSAAPRGDSDEGRTPRGVPVAPTAGESGAEPHVGEVTGGSRPDPDGALDASDDPAREASGVARLAHEVATGCDHGDQPKGAEATSRSRREPHGAMPRRGASRGACPTYGGDHAIAWREATRRAGRHRRQARDVERALRALLRRVDVGGLDASPRVDARRLVREIASRRLSLSRASRREITRPLVVLACDVSGSCSATCDATLAAAAAIAGESDGRTIAVRHSNGRCLDAVGAVHRPIQLEGLAAYVSRLGHEVAAVVAWGDTDAGDEYRALCEAGAALYWLDSYAARHGARTASVHLRAHAADWRRQPVGWWQGVNDAATTAIALRDMASEMRT